MTRQQSAAIEEGQRAAGQPDAYALAVARAAQQAAGTGTVILFGSRARGDHRPNSDIDLLLITDDGKAARGRAYSAVRAYLRDDAARLNFDLVSMTRETFDYCRRARNHVAAQALRDGIIMNDDQPDYPVRHDDEYPLNWPDISQRIINTRNNIRAMNYLLSDEDGSHQEVVGFLAQQAIENALKGWLSALDIDYYNRHDIPELAKPLLRHATEAGAPSGVRLRELMEYRHAPTSREDDPEDWLTKYAVHYRYSGTAHRMDDAELERFVGEIRTAVSVIVNRIYELTGADASMLDD